MKFYKKRNLEMQEDEDEEYLRPPPQDKRGEHGWQRVRDGSRQLGLLHAQSPRQPQLHWRVGWAPCSTAVGYIKLWATPSVSYRCSDHVKQLFLFQLRKLFFFRNVSCQRPFKLSTVRYMRVSETHVYHHLYFQRMGLSNHKKSGNCTFAKLHSLKEEEIHLAA